MHVMVITVKIALQRIFPPRGCGGPEKDRDLFLSGGWRVSYEVISASPWLSDVPLV